MKTLGLDPREIKYVLISHAHGDHDQGAALLQNRYGAKVVMGAADWDATLRIRSWRRAETRYRGGR
jgi:metallo-beta-lactamase class B